MTDYVALPLSYVVIPKGSTIFCERATVIEVVDEAAGPFITIKQELETLAHGEVSFDEEEWPLIVGCVETLRGTIKFLNENTSTEDL